MIDTDKLIAMAEDNILHKKIVLDNCLILGKYLIKEGKINLGISLFKRGSEHDNSKFDTEEFTRLSKILKSKKCFIDAKTQLSKEERKAIQYHWEHNRHHPEFHVEPSDDMSELDILEMVCDWYARSKQYGTEFIPFVMERQENRFKFSEDKFKQIIAYCSLLERLDNEDPSHM